MASASERKRRRIVKVSGSKKDEKTKKFLMKMKTR
jgi:hypothetical protein